MKSPSLNLLRYRNFHICLVVSTQVGRRFTTATFNFTLILYQFDNDSSELLFCLLELGFSLSLSVTE